MVGLEIQESHSKKQKQNENTIMKIWYLQSLTVNNQTVSM